MNSASEDMSGEILLSELVRAARAFGANPAQEVCVDGSVLCRGAQHRGVAAALGRAVAGRAVPLHRHSTHLTQATTNKVGKWAAF